MTESEKRFVEDLFETVKPNRITKEEFYAVWRNKDFTDTLQWIFEEDLSTAQRTVLRLRYGENLTFKDIADKVGVSASRIGQIRNKALFTLYQKSFSKLCMGRKAYEEFLSHKREEMEKILKENAKKNEKDPLLKDMGLSSRVINIFRRKISRDYPDVKFDTVRASFVVNNIRNLSSVMNCGKGSMREIIEAFEKFDFNISKWKKELQMKSKQSEIITNDVLNFIFRRFPYDAMWSEKNCYYFAVILKDRFPDGVIYYDVKEGHFLTKIRDKLYDNSGEQTEENRTLVKWDEFSKYDKLQAERIIQHCIK